ncbi:MAG: bifunctional [glutamate--ammonia ligase]-adenylyl-L-tyrosine phosphorylase/[glutamate--ammonia-ligase] adenylyltransferase, partial [Mariprofundus sp.]|nr:bifunctional [glutamate--ammonia ligase]-adenylyl-L-tyrosine phosphorylase/[glutamate--ammonia-ligase] adenylyltransferase [Mariprofundus sp.]
PREILGKRSMGEHAQRLGRRMIQYLTGNPPFGAGFEFDARLRPSGSSGVLVTGITGFRDYQLHEAQTWEHQALCRARSVAGQVEDRKRVDEVVQNVLNQKRDHAALAADVLTMRHKMLNHLGSKSDAIINLKQDAGGMVDIEFMAQFARLAFAIKARRTIDILHQLPKSAPDGWHQYAGFLAETYLNYRQMENVLRVELWSSIGKLPNDPAAIEWETMRRHAAVDSPQRLVERMTRVNRIFHALIVGTDVAQE